MNVVSWDIVAASKLSVGGKLGFCILFVEREMEEEQLINVIVVWTEFCLFSLFLYGESHSNSWVYVKLKIKG